MTKTAQLTPGPWTWDGGGNVWGPEEVGVASESPGDAAYIVLACNERPVLLAQRDALLAALEALRRATSANAVPLGNALMQADAAIDAAREEEKEQ